MGDIDGINVWNELQKDTDNNITTILHNIDDKFETYAVTQGHYKLIKGSTYKTNWDNWYGHSGRNFTYVISKVLTSTVARSLNLNLSTDQIKSLRLQASVNCTKTCVQCCNPLVKSCLFDIRNDPCENYDLSKR